ncbi:MAG: hypothetical protein R3B06_04685 [Kofleriaceae bacterium]
MPIQIDRMDTSIELTDPAPASGATPPRERRATPASDAAARDAVRDLVGAVMSEELEHFLRNRGM